MPQIKEYTSRSEVAGPVSTRAPNSDIISGVGRAVQNLGESIDQSGQIIQRRMDQDEISNLNRELASLEADSTVDLQGRLQKGLTSDPSEDTSGATGTMGTTSAEDGTDMAQKFMDDLNGKLDKVSEKIGTRAGRLYFENQRATLSQHFLQHAKAGQAELAGVRAKSNFIQAMNADAGALMNDPSSFNLKLSRGEQTIKGLVEAGGLPAVKAEELRLNMRSEYAKSAVRGWARLNPQDAKAQLDSGQWDGMFDADVKKQLYGQIEEEERGRRADAALMRSEQERELKQKQMGVENDFLNKLQSKKLKPREVLDSILSPDDKVKYIGMIEKEATTRIKADPGTVTSLFQRIHAKDGDPKRITDEKELNKYFGRGLDTPSLNMLRAEVQGRRSPDGEFRSAMVAQIEKEARATLVKGGGFGIPDPKGEEIMSAWQASFLADLQDKSSKGLGIRSLLTKGHKDYIGDSYKNFERTLSEKTKDMVPKMEPMGGGKIAPRKEGESPAEYLQRIKQEKAAAN